VEQTGRARSINREKFHLATLETQLADPTSIQHQVFYGYLHLLRQRRAQPAFHPNGGQRVLALDDSLFALIRIAPDSPIDKDNPAETATLTEGGMVLCLVNVSETPQMVNVDQVVWDLPPVSAWHDLIGEGVYPVQEGCLSLALDGYQALWLRPAG
jgi:sucrose phosphorylase